MTNRTPSHIQEAQNQCLKYLELTARDRENNNKMRLYYAQIGRRYNLSWEEMGRALGVTGAAVRMMVHRADQEQKSGEQNG